jgi:oxygen-independent coproporphyrinogen-3 oxidase
MPGLYIHIPFCVSKCYYCDFYSEAGKLHLLGDYLNALLMEAGQYRGPGFDTLYIGGGTPSLLGAAGLEQLMNGLAGCFDLTKLHEAIVEANPDTAGSEFLDVALACGISRLSIGVQSLNDDELAKSGRLHNAGQALTAIAKARDCGFEDISADIIVGLPGQTTGSLENTLCGLLHSAVTHISAYCLSVEPGSEFARHTPPGLPDDDAQAGLFELAARYLKENGFVHYEISNFALPGRECRHNLNYWRGGEYLGLGPGAASHLHGRRTKNAADLHKYIKDPLAAQCEAEELGAEAKSAEEAMLRLRLLEEGLDISSLAARYGTANTDGLRRRLNKLADDKMLARTGTCYRLPPERVITSNRVFIEIID